MDWKLAEAKNKFSELVSRALLEGPQRVRRRKDSVYVISESEFAGYTGKKPSFKAFIKQKGLAIDDLDTSRDKSAMRDVEL